MNNKNVHKMNLSESRSDLSLADQILPFFKPNTACLTDEETSSALQEKYIAYPEVIRSITDPGENNYALLSFLKSHDHSYVKVRGYGSLVECKDKAKSIIKLVDSRFPIAIAKVGQWVYVTSEPKEVSKETIKIVDEKEVTHKEHVDVLMAEHEKKITVAEESSANERHIDNKTPLEAFILSKVKVYETYKQIQFLDKKISLLKERQALLLKLIEDNSQYETVWLKEYMTQLASVGIRESTITETVLKEASKMDLPKILCVDITKRLEEVESEYNKLRYSSVNF